MRGRTDAVGCVEVEEDKVMADGALAGLRILECGDFVAAPYAAALLGHLGADVVKVEPPGGDTNRHRGPFPTGCPDLETSGLHLFLDQTKRSVVLDLETDHGRDELRQLATAADALIASGPPELLERRGLTYAALNGANPALVVTAVTPRGLTGPRQGLPMRELCDLAASGWLSLSPGALDNPDLPPLKPFGQQAHYQAGIHAAIATLGALAARDTTGAGQQVDISVQAVIASQIENGLVHYTYGGRVASRLGVRMLGPWGTVTLADGLLFIVCVTEDEWHRLLAFLGHPEWADSPLFADRLVRAEHNDALLPLLEAELAGREVYPTYLALQAARVPCAPVAEMRDLLSNEHLAARGFFAPADHPIAGRWTYPGAPWQLSDTPWQPGRPAPFLGEHTDAVRREWAAGSRGEPRSLAPILTRERDAGPAAAAGSRLPLADVRVVDFTWAWAGPTCTLQLAHLGADVIKIESAARMDTVRGLPPFWQDVRSPNRSGYFNQYSQGKRSLTLDLKHPDAHAVVHSLVRCADVVVDNFSAGALERMGFGYDVLRAITPDIIQISMAAHGQTGPLAPFIAYGPTQVPMTGLLSLTGYPDGGPREVGISYGDPNGGINAAVAVLAALHHRRRTGRGQSIDMSQWEAALPLVVEGLLTHQMTGQQPPRMGNRDEFQAPQGVFRCAGTDQWVAISCWSDGEWHALARVLGRPDLCNDPALSTAQGRKAREAELEAAITAWSAGRSPQDAATTLQQAGVPAVPVSTTEELTRDPVLAAREFWVQLPHPECTGARHAGIPWRFSGTPLQVRAAAPVLGQHTEEVLGDVVALTHADITHLRDGGALA